jgi:hypothetical protein
LNLSQSRFQLASTSCRNQYSLVEDWMELTLLILLIFLQLFQFQIQSLNRFQSLNQIQSHSIHHWHHLQILQSVNILFIYDVECVNERLNFFVLIFNSFILNSINFIVFQCFTINISNNSNNKWKWQYCNFR